MIWIKKCAPTKGSQPNGIVYLRQKYIFEWKSVYIKAGFAIFFHMHFARTPRLIQHIFPSFTWRVRTKAPVLYLSFDDGPIPEVTPWVLDLLGAYDAKACFFCVGENVKKHFDIFQRIVNEGHTVGNHSYNHLHGWHTPTDAYLDNVKKCAHWVSGSLFRPPYGALRPRQIVQLRKQYQIVMWDVLSYDFNPKVSAAQCVQNVVKNVQSGSIIVFHDSLKAKVNLQYALPRVLEELTQKGYCFEALK
jgi:peptidoglycan-N-acetylglucosamine deacetylase